MKEYLWTLHSQIFNGNKIILTILPSIELSAVYICARQIYLRFYIANDSLNKKSSLYSIYLSSGTALAPIGASWQVLVATWL